MGCLLRDGLPVLDSHLSHAQLLLAVLVDEDQDDDEDGNGSNEKHDEDDAERPEHIGEMLREATHHACKTIVVDVHAHLIIVTGLGNHAVDVATVSSLINRGRVGECTDAY